jgi:enoyl-[acyl-carrier protein] reductase I
MAERYVQLRSPKSNSKKASAMIPAVKAKLLEGKKGLIVGIANDQSIAWGCAKAFRAFGAELAVTYLNDKAKKYVEPLARELEAPIVMPLDVRTPGQMEAVFERIAKDWGRLDFVVHSIAFSPKERCRAASSTSHATAFSPPWTCRAGRSSAWPIWPSR